MTPAEALAAFEAADKRKEAAKTEQLAADAAWVDAAAALAGAIQTALPEEHNPTVLIAGKVVSVEFDGYWTVNVQTPPVLG